MSDLRLPFVVTPDDGDPYEVVADSRDIYVWEKTTPNKQCSLATVLEEMRFLELYRICWIAARRQGMYGKGLDEFSQECQIEPDEIGEVEPDPTPPAPTAGPSSRSPSSPASRPRSGRKKVSGR